MVVIFPGKLDENVRNLSGMFPVNNGVWDARKGYSAGKIGDGSGITKLLLMMIDHQWTTKWVDQWLYLFKHWVTIHSYYFTGSQSIFTITIAIVIIIIITIIVFTIAIIVDNPHPDVCREPTQTSHGMTKSFSMDPDDVWEGLLPRPGRPESWRFSESVVMPFYISSYGVADLDPI